MRWHSCVEYPYDVSSCEGCYGEAMEKEQEREWEKMPEEEQWHYHQMEVEALKASNGPWFGWSGGRA